MYNTIIIKQDMSEIKGRAKMWVKEVLKEIHPECMYVQPSFKKVRLDDDMLDTMFGLYLEPEPAPQLAGAMFQSLPTIHRRHLFDLVLDMCPQHKESELISSLDSPILIKAGYGYLNIACAGEIGTFFIPKIKKEEE